MQHSQCAYTVLYHFSPIRSRMYTRSMPRMMSNYQLKKEAEANKDIGKLKLNMKSICKLDIMHHFGEVNP